MSVVDFPCFYQDRSLFRRSLRNCKTFYIFALKKEIPLGVEEILAKAVFTCFNATRNEIENSFFCFIGSTLSDMAHHGFIDETVHNPLALRFAHSFLWVSWTMRYVSVQIWSKSYCILATFMWLNKFWVKIKMLFLHHSLLNWNQERTVHTPGAQRIQINTYLRVNVVKGWSMSRQKNIKVC